MESPHVFDPSLIALIGIVAVADLAGIILFSVFAYFWKRGRLAA